MSEQRVVVRMRRAAVTCVLAGLATAGVNLLSHGGVTTDVAYAEIVASSCASGKRAGWADRQSPELRVRGKSVASGELHAGDWVTTDGRGVGKFCLRVGTLQCDIFDDSRFRVLPTGEKNVLFRLKKSQGGLFCSANSATREWKIMTPFETVSIGDLSKRRPIIADSRFGRESQSAHAASTSSGNVFSLVVSNKRSLVKIRRGATIVLHSTDGESAVVVGRQQQVVVLAGRAPSQPVGIRLTPAERRTFRKLERSLPPPTDRTPPAVTIRGPRNPSSVRYATFLLTATEAGATLSCALDDTDFRLCATPHRIDALKPGRHTLAVKVTDLTGNTRTNSYSWTVDNSQIAFQSDRDGNSDIYVMDPDGTNQRRLTTSSAADADADWSHDRRRIVFHSERDRNSEIYVMNADGSGQTRLTSDSATDRNPTWSPDGTRIAFESFRDGNREIYVMNADGSGQRRLTTNPAEDFDPAWSPGSNRIVFASARDGGNIEIYVMSADGTAQTRLVSTPGADFGPAWSPDGTRIVFNSDRDTRYQNLQLVNADGSNLQVLKKTERNDWNPAWAPDGGHIVFQSDRDHPDVSNGFEIYIIDLDGLSEVRLTDGAGNNLVPDW